MKNARQEKEQFLHQKFHESLIFLKKKHSVNFWFMQRRKEAFFDQIAFISRIFLEIILKLRFFASWSFLSKFFARTIDIENINVFH